MHVRASNKKFKLKNIEFYKSLSAVIEKINKNKFFI